MNLETKVMEQLKTAMKAKNDVALRTLRGIKAAILVEKTAEGGTKDLGEVEELKIIQKMVKQRQDSFEIFTKQDRADLALKEQEELEVLKNFLPQQLTSEELGNAIGKVIADTGAQGMKDMGKAIGAANKALAGKADGKAIADEVKKQLA